MQYALSIEQFNRTFSIKDGGTKLTHNSGKRFKLFPFIANNNVEPVLDLNEVVGRYLSKIEGMEPTPITAENLISKLKEKTSIDPGMETIFDEVVRNIFFDADGQLRPVNLRMLEQIQGGSNSELRLTDYLVDVLGDKTVLRACVEAANKKLYEQSNVFERIVVSSLESKPMVEPDSIAYFQVTNALQELFESDFDYILANRNRTRDYLIPLLEFYYFTYTAQTCLQLSRFLDGERKHCVPIFFALEWEKTSQSRQCFTEGWDLLQQSIRKIFSHAITLEILNQTSDYGKIVDYIGLNELASVSDEEDQRIAEQIKALTNAYRQAISDCPEMHELKRVATSVSATAAEIKFLFDSVNCQFENTVRSRPYSSYAAKFEEYCRKYLKRRGRSGMMLNITEETLIFLTKLCIKDQEKMRLNDIFKEFTARGIYLDNQSKEQVMYYYERLNLIEKKSDSGDAQYVKRIL